MYPLNETLWGITQLVNEVIIGTIIMVAAGIIAGYTYSHFRGPARENPRDPGLVSNLTPIADTSDAGNSRQNDLTRSRSSHVMDGVTRCCAEMASNDIRVR